MGERTGKGVNGGAGVEKRKGEGESDEGSSLKDKDSTSRDGSDGATKVKRRRGTCMYIVHIYKIEIIADFLHNEMNGVD